MSIKCSVYIATSVDGFIAKPDGDIEWLHRPEYADANIEGLNYDDFISTVDTLIMGRGTFEKVLSFDGWPYDGTPVIVLTSRDLEIPQSLQGRVGLASGSPTDLVARLESEGKRHVYIDGGETIPRFLREGLVHEITITRIPLLLGSGIPLFDSAGQEIPMRLIAANSSDNGFVQVRYEVTPQP